MGLMGFFLIFRNVLFIFREGEGREREKKTLMCERNTDQLPLAHPLLGTQPLTQVCALTGNREPR